MTQHEYVFIAVSIILGLAITRLLSSVAGLVRAHKRVTFHWATALWGASVMLFILQLWWVGWELRAFSNWTIFDFCMLVMGAIFVYGAAELSLPTEDYDISDDSELNFIAHSHSLGRVSAASMLGYFCVGPYVNITLFGNPVLPSVGVPLFGGLLTLLIILKPGWFKILSFVFANYAMAILYLTS
ncbi:MAG: hypothetical protein ACI87W_002504 [Halieaceae bacterium]|jgi:hypothetical protein